jgi:hypothetical protein
MICLKISGKGSQGEIRYRHAKIADSSHASPDASAVFCCHCATASTGSHLALFKNRNRRANADATRLVLPWKQAESNGRVIGFVISSAALTPQVAHNQQLGGEGS